MDVLDLKLDPQIHLRGVISVRLLQASTISAYVSVRIPPGYTILSGSHLGSTPKYARSELPSRLLNPGILSGENSNLEDSMDDVAPPTLSIQPIDASNWRDSLQPDVLLDQLRFASAPEPFSMMGLAEAFINPEGLSWCAYAPRFGTALNWGGFIKGRLCQKVVQLLCVPPGIGLAF